MKKQTSDYFAKTLEKGLRVLALFDEDHSSWTLTAIAEKVEVNLTTAYRLVNTFLELGYFKKDPKTKLLSLGPMAIALGNRLLRGFDINKVVEPLVDEAHYKYRISIDVSLFHRFNLVQLYKKEDSNTLTYKQETVSEFFYCTAMGKAVLSCLDAAEQEDLVERQSFKKMAENTIIDKNILYRELAEIRKKGYATNNEEYIKGLIAIAAPILRRGNNTPLGAISFTTTILDQTLVEFEKNYALILCDLARKIARKICNI
ncbi:MAG: IclR family transcriptional regulator [Deltaproteobacteria bacterium]|nr:IclR family transcriptional regulator [Deltaproteobacteria bacterium]NCP02660.1 IclR family transcriptional regulator [Deltaproteobacteria bacterium]